MSVSALDGALADSPIDPRGDVDASCIRFALDDERLGPCEIPDREADNRGEDERHDGRGSRRASLWPFALGFGLVTIFRRRALFYVRHAIFVSRREGRLALIVAQRRTGAPP